MTLTEEMKTVIQNSPYLSLITLHDNGAPHPIIVGGKTLENDVIVIGIYKMEETQKNLAKNNTAWIMASTVDDGPKGYRFKGNAVVKDKQVVFTPETAEAMI